MNVEIQWLRGSRLARARVPYSIVRRKEGLI